MTSGTNNRRCGRPAYLGRSLSVIVGSSSLVHTLDSFRTDRQRSLRRVHSAHDGRSVLFDRAGLVVIDGSSAQFPQGAVPLRPCLRVRARHCHAQRAMMPCLAERIRNRTVRLRLVQRARRRADRLPGQRRRRPGCPGARVHGDVDGELREPLPRCWRRPARARARADDRERAGSAGCQVVMLDLRGHGHSGRPHDPGAYGLEIFAEGVRSLVAHLGLSLSAWSPPPPARCPARW